MVGTRCYFAPERIVGTSFQSSADIWALGVTVSMYATRACVLKLATSVCGLQLLVYAAFSYSFQLSADIWALGVTVSM